MYISSILFMLVYIVFLSVIFCISFCCCRCFTTNKAEMASHGKRRNENRSKNKSLYKETVNQKFLSDKK